MIRTFTACVLIVSLTIASSSIFAEGEEPHADTFVLQPDLLALLQAEMREITTGVQKIPVAIAQADWRALAQTSASIQSSYIMAKALTKEQAEALESDLPERFKQMDSEFHARAGMLAQAAEARDFELASYHYSRLVESCARCHATYARARFPGFEPAKEHGHQH